MTEGIEPVIAERFMLERLKAQSALMAAPLDGRIWGHAAPQAIDSAQPDYPFCLYSQSAIGNDLGALGGILIWSVLEYAVRVVEQTDSWEAVEPLADEIATALDNTGGTVDGGVVHSCTRVRPFLLPEIRNGVQYRHLGGVYRLLVKGA